jgi:hypothetical protein
MTIVAIWKLIVPAWYHNSYSTCFLSALGAVYKEKFGTVTGKPFAENAICKAEVVIGNATDANGFRVSYLFFVQCAAPIMTNRHPISSLSI